MIARQAARVAERAEVGVAVRAREDLRWGMRATLHKFDASALRRAGLDPDGLVDLALAAALGVEPDEVLTQEVNLLTFGGASCLWECLIGNGTATGGANLTFFNNANAHLGVGNGTTAAAATQTDLQGASKLRKAMDASQPAHTDGTTDGSDDITFKSTFGTADANFAWEEWGVFNGSSAGRMLNRKVAALGTKTSSATWVFTVTLTLS